MPGASAVCTRTMRSPGMSAIGSIGHLRASAWKVSRIRPTWAWSAVLHRLPGLAVVVDVPAPAQGLEADGDAVRLGELA